jgi:hypothetical protein
MSLHYKELQYGFEYGDATVTRLMSDEKKGWVIVEVKSRKESLQVYVTKTGKIRVYGDGEWRRPETKKIKKR